MDTSKRYLGMVSQFKSLKADNTTDILYDVGPADTQGLTDLQKAYAQKIIDIVGQFGQFEQNGASGCQYTSKSPLLNEGTSCGSCVFYAGGGDCSIVEDQIDPLGLCRFNVVPAAS